MVLMVPTEQMELLVLKVRLGLKVLRDLKDQQV
jgi:hypothetical protein